MGSSCPRRGNGIVLAILERDTAAAKAAILVRQVGELTAARDEAAVALRHAQSASESALADKCKKTEAGKVSWHAAKSAQAQLAEQLATAQRECEA